MAIIVAPMIMTGSKYTTKTEGAAIYDAGIAWALSAPKVTSRDKIVLIGLWRHANRETGECFPSHALLSKEIREPISSISKAIGALQKAGLIVVTKKWKKNYYSFTFQNGK